MRRLIAAAVFTAFFAALLLALGSSAAAAPPDLYKVYNCEATLLDGYYECPDGVTVSVRADGKARVFGPLVLVSGTPVAKVTHLTMAFPDVADLGPMDCRILLRPSGDARTNCSN